MLSFLYSPTLNPHMTTGKKKKALTRWAFVGKVMSLLFNMLSRLVIAFLSRSKRLWISWLQSPFAVIFWSLPNKVCHCFHCFPIYLPWSDGPRCHDLSTLWLSSRGSLVLLCSLPKGWCHLRLLIFSLQSWFQLVLHPTWHFTWCTLHIS